MVIAVTAYGMATLEGPLLSIKSINAISHYTDWTVGHVHVGTLGWNGMLTFGILYWLWPRLYKTQLYSVKLANTHFWLSTTGVLFYCVPLYWAGWTQSMMWKKFNIDGFLEYANFLETVTQILPMYKMRALGGAIYVAGVLLMAYNLWKTTRTAAPVEDTLAKAPARVKYNRPKGEYWHRWIERRPIQMLFLSSVLVLIGGIIEITPMLIIDKNIPKIENVKPYTALELEGRDIYIREGCVGCHSQMVRPFRSETERYGEFSKSGEFIYDRPFLWGSKRTGPDLHRLGGKYSHFWHYEHMREPASLSPGSIMPPYPHLLDDDINTSYTKAKINVLRGVFNVDKKKIPM